MDASKNLFFAPSSSSCSMVSHASSSLVFCSICLVALANDIKYGLSSTLWSSDLDRTMRISKKLEALGTLAAGTAHELATPLSTIAVVARDVEKAFDDVLRKGLKVMDTTAFTLSQENKLPIIVFDMNKKGNLLKVVSGENIGTKVNL